MTTCPLQSVGNMNNTTQGSDSWRSGHIIHEPFWGFSVLPGNSWNPGDIHNCEKLTLKLWMWNCSQCRPSSRTSLVRSSGSRGLTGLWRDLFHRYAFGLVSGSAGVWYLSACKQLMMIPSMMERANSGRKHAMIFKKWNGSIKSLKDLCALDSFSTSDASRILISTHNEAPGGLAYSRMRQCNPLLTSVLPFSSLLVRSAHFHSQIIKYSCSPSKYAAVAPTFWEYRLDLTRVWPFSPVTPWQTSITPHSSYECLIFNS